MAVWCVNLIMNLRTILPTHNFSRRIYFWYEVFSGLLVKKDISWT